ncbi:MAG: hypothetical protein ACR2FU_05750, partial [Streptosporangiaceae bacterium]
MAGMKPEARGGAAAPGWPGLVHAAVLGTGRAAFPSASLLDPAGLGGPGEPDRPAGPGESGGAARSGEDVAMLHAAALLSR